MFIETDKVFLGEESFIGIINVLVACSEFVMQVKKIHIFIMFLHTIAVSIWKHIHAEIYSQKDWTN